MWKKQEGLLQRARQIGVYTERQSPQGVELEWEAGFLQAAAIRQSINLETSHWRT